MKTQTDTRSTVLEPHDTAECRVLEITRYDVQADATETTVITSELPRLSLEVEDRGHEMVLDR